MTTDEKIQAFRQANPFRTVQEEIEFLRELTEPWLDKPKWWLRRYLIKRERSFVALVRTRDG